MCFLRRFESKVSGRGNLQWGCCFKRWLYWCSGRQWLGVDCASNRERAVMSGGGDACAVSGGAS